MIEFAQRYSISPGDIEVARVDMTDSLSSTETLSSVTVTNAGTTGLTLGTATVNTGSTYIYGRTVATGKGASWSVQGQVINRTYTMLFTGVTSASRTLKRHALFDCR